MQQQCEIELDWQAAALPGLGEIASEIINDLLDGGFWKFHSYSNNQPSMWATSDTTTGLLVSDEGALVMSLVASKEGPSWGTVVAG